MKYSNAHTFRKYVKCILMYLHLISCLVQISTDNSLDMWACPESKPVKERDLPVHVLSANKKGAGPVAALPV